MKWIATMTFCILLGTNGWAQTFEAFPSPTSKPVPLPPVKTLPSNAKTTETDVDDSKSMVVAEAIIIEGQKGSSPDTDAKIKNLINELRRVGENPPPVHQDAPAINRAPQVASNPISTLPAPEAIQSARLAAFFQKNTDFTVLSRPTLVMVAGAPAIVSIGHEVPLEYMEQVDSDTFKLRHTDPKKLGIDLSITAAEPRKAGSEHAGKRIVTLSKIEFSLSALEGRQKIPNVNLPIGMPTITRRTIATSLELFEGEPTFVTLPLENDKLVYVILMVRILEAPGTEPRPNAVQN